MKQEVINDNMVQNIEFRLQKNHRLLFIAANNTVTDDRRVWIKVFSTIKWRYEAPTGSAK